MPRPKKNAVPETDQATGHRLDFLRNFLAAVGLSQKDVAQLAGVSTVTVSNWFRSDNMRIDQVTDIISKTGYTASIILTRRNDMPELPINVTPEDFNDGEGRFVLKRMAFLSFALREIGVTKQELAERLGITPYSVTAWYKADTVAIDRVFQIAKAYDLNIYIDIQPAKNTNKRTAPSIVTKMTVMTEYAV